jgi:hypothetical protein
MPHLSHSDKDSSSRSHHFVLVVPLFVLVLLALTLYVYLNFFLHDGHMHFPLTPRGMLSSNPVADLSGTDPTIRWRTKGACTGGEYQVVTDDYVQDKHFGTWQGANVTCRDVPNSSDQECEAMHTAIMTPLLEQGRTLWFVARAFGCPNGQDLVESPILILKK